MTILRDNKLKVLIAVLFLILAAIAVYKIFPAEAVIRVGDKIISKEEVSLKLSADNCYLDEKSEDRLPSVLSLINANLEDQVLEKYYNFSISITDLKAKSLWVDQNTKAPDILACIKKSYGNKTNLYLNNFIAAAPVNQKLHELFQMDADIHGSARKHIEGVLGRSTAQSFSNVAGYREVVISSEANSNPQELLTNPQSILSTQSLVEDEALEAKLRAMKPGEIWNAVIETKYSYMLVKMNTKTNGKYVFGVISSPKKSFDEWFRAYAIENVAVIFKDKKLESRVKEAYPNLWWLNPKNS